MNLLSAQKTLEGLFIRVTDRLAFEAGAVQAEHDVRHSCTFGDFLHAWKRSVQIYDRDFNRGYLSYLRTHKRMYRRIYRSLEPLEAYQLRDFISWLICAMCEDQALADELSFMWDYNRLTLKGGLK